MIPITTSPYASSGEMLDTALDVLEHYGFSPIDSMVERRRPGKRLAAAAALEYIHPHERKFVTPARLFAAHNLAESTTPELVYQIDPIDKGKNRPASISLHIAGTATPASEALLIAATVALLKEAGVERPVVHINSIGTHECSQRFLRETNIYLRRVMNDLPAYARDAARKNPLHALAQLIENREPIAEQAPNPMEFLNEESRKNLWEILEHLETAHIPFELDPHVLGSCDCFEHTLFDIRSENEDGALTLARGGRYNTIHRRAFGENVEATGMVIDYERQGRMTHKKRSATTPHFYFAHLSREARLLSLPVLDMLRTEGISVRQSLTQERISDQLAYSEAVTAPYVIIIGYKEALDNTAIVRNNKTRAQDVIPIADLAKHLRRLKVA